MRPPSGLSSEAMNKERGSISMSAYATSLWKKAPGYKERASKKARVEAEEASEI